MIEYRMGHEEATQSNFEHLKSLGFDMSRPINHRIEERTHILTQEEESDKCKKIIAKVKIREHKNAVK